MESTVSTVDGVHSVHSWQSAVSTVDGVHSVYSWQSSQCLQLTEFTVSTVDGVHRTYSWQSSQCLQLTEFSVYSWQSSVSTVDRVHSIYSWQSSQCLQLTEFTVSAAGSVHSIWILNTSTDMFSSSPIPEYIDRHHIQLLSKQAGLVAFICANTIV